MLSIIGGLYRGRRLSAPAGLQTRPTSGRLRESFFNICRNRIEDAVFLDLFAGSGAMGFEALSRGARAAVFVDSGRDAIRCIRENAFRLNVESQCRIECADAIKTAERLNREKVAFDIIYADPPYHRSETSQNISYSTRLLETIDSLCLLNPGGVLFVEENILHPPEISNPKTLRLKDSRRIGPAILLQYERLDG